MANFLLGKDAVTYYSTTLFDGGTTPNQTIIDGALVANNIMDLSLDVESDFVEITTRQTAAQGFKAFTATLKNSTITFDALWNPDDGAWFTALKDVWDTGAPNEIGIVCFDQARGVASGAQGIIGNFTVGFTKEEPLNDAQKVSVTLTASSYVQWHEEPAS